MNLEPPFLAKVLIFVIFGPEMKVQRSIKAPGCSKINIKVIRDMQSTSKVDKNSLEFKIITLWHNFNENLYFSTPEPRTQTTCSLKMAGLSANFTKMRNFCLKMSSNRLILTKRWSLLEFGRFWIQMAIHCHPYYGEDNQCGMSSYVRMWIKTVDVG